MNGYKNVATSIAHQFNAVECQGIREKAGGGYNSLPGSCATPNIHAPVFQFALSVNESVVFVIVQSVDHYRISVVDNGQRGITCL